MKDNPVIFLLVIAYSLLEITNMNSPVGEDKVASIYIREKLTKQLQIIGNLLLLMYN